MTPNRSNRYWHYVYLSCGIVAMWVFMIGAYSLDRPHAIILSGVTFMAFVGWIAGVFRKDLPKVLRVEHEQMVRALAPDRADQAFNISVLPRRAERDGLVPDPHCSDAG